MRRLILLLPIFNDIQGTRSSSQAGYLFVQGGGDDLAGSKWRPNSFVMTTFLEAAEENETF